MLTKTPVVRALMAAFLYLMLMWGYTSLPNVQTFAVYLALVMCAALTFWVGESTFDRKSASCGSESGNKTAGAAARACSEATSEEGHRSDVDSLESAIMRLDSLKQDLVEQYAQFGRDQSLINSNGLGSWHGTRKPGGR